MSLLKEKKIVNDINGLIILDKPSGYTSNDCLTVIKKCLHPKKIGHTGTLDENATGVLACLLGSATKCQDYLMKSGDKIYKAELILGISTDTEDITGNVLQYDSNIGDKFGFELIEKTMKSFVGKYLQVPPMYSAKKVGGKKLLNLARKGISVERKACDVVINKIEVDDEQSLDYTFNNYKLKKVSFVVSCSKGTYIRTLCKDIGDKIGIPSCMGNLRRIATGEFKIDDSVNIDMIKKMSEKNDYSFIRPCYYQPEDSVVTFGKFETLHLGHQKIIKEVVKDAKEKKLKSIVMMVGNNSDSKILTRDQRISKLKFFGVDDILNFELNDINLKMQAESFIEEILVKQLKTREIIVGSDCSFGYRGVGNTGLLTRIASKHNIDVKIIDKIKLPEMDTYISSTLIKEEYEKGNIELVNKLLGK